MEYSKLKSVIDTKAFDLIAKMINSPTCELCLPNYNNIENPFTSTGVDVTSVSQEEYVNIKLVNCIYTYDRLFVQENDTKLGSEFSLMVYIKYDDIPDDILNNISSLVIKFDNIYYPVKKSMNLYRILYEFGL